LGGACGERSGWGCAGSACDTFGEMFTLFGDMFTAFGEMFTAGKFGDAFCDTVFF
jgi:hypothetical protein